MAFARKVDRNHGEVVDAMRRVGWFVHDTSGAGRGFPDLVAARGGRLVLVEVKGPKGKLTPEQLLFLGEMKSRGVEVHIVRSAEEAARL
jgi:Holliday junction resolvase